MKKILFLLAILASVVLSGCAVAPGIFNGLSDDGMAMLVIYRTDNKALSKEQYDKVVVVAKQMGITIGWQLSSAFEAGATGGAAFGAAGALGGSTQSYFYSGASAGAAAGYTGVVYGLGGIVNGMVTASYANIHALEAAVEMALRDAEKYDGAKNFQRIHVVGAYVRSRNKSGEPAPNLVPDYHGPIAGAEKK